MARARRIILGILATVLLLPLAAAVAVWLFLEDADIERFIERRVTEATGRHLELGNLEIDWGWDTTRFTASRISLANPDWTRAPTMFTAEHASLSLDPGALLHGDVHLPRLTLSGGNLSLLRSETGRVNWDVVPETAAAVPESRADLPALDEALLRDLTVEYRDLQTGRERKIVLERARLAMEGSGLRLEGEGALDGLPMRFRAEGAPLRRLRSPDVPYPLRGQLIVNETRLAVNGELTDAPAQWSFNADVRLGGPDLARLFPIAGIPAPPSAPYVIEGRLHREGSMLRLEDLDATVGGSDLHGTIAIDLAPHPPMIKGSITAQRVDPKDVGMFLVRGREETALLPRARISEDRLHALGLELEVRIDTLETPIQRLRDVRLGIVLRDGRLVIDPMRVGLAGGRVEGSVRVDAVGIPGLGWDLDLSGIRVGRVLPDIEAVEDTNLVIGGSTKFSGKGETVAQAIGNGDGRIELIGTGGRLDRFIVEAADLDVGELLAHLGEDLTTPIRCAVMIFDIRNGIARAENVVVDTRDSVIVVAGLINLRSETLNLEVDARAKDPSIGTLGNPVKVQGTFDSPRIDPVGSPVAEVLGAAALGALFGPAAALLPFIELGNADPVACRELIQKAEEQD